MEGSTDTLATEYEEQPSDLVLVSQRRVRWRMNGCGRLGDALFGRCAGRVSLRNLFVH